MNERFSPPKALTWTSYILQALIGIAFLMGATMNLLQTEEAVKGATDMGYPESGLIYLGLALLLSTILFLIPKTSGLGAILLTGWLGGAIATHAINGDPLVNVVIPILFGILVWFSIWLRQKKVRNLVDILGS